MPKYAKLSNRSEINLDDDGANSVATATGVIEICVKATLFAPLLFHHLYRPSDCMELLRSFVLLSS